MRLEFRSDRISAFLRAPDAAISSSAVHLALHGRARLVGEDDYNPNDHDVSPYSQWIALPAVVSFVSESEWPAWRREFRELLTTRGQWSPERCDTAASWLDGDLVQAMLSYFPHDPELSPREARESDTVDITVRLDDAHFVSLQQWLHEALVSRLPLPHLRLIGVHFARAEHGTPTWAEFVAGGVFVPASCAIIDLTPAPVDARK